MDKSQWENVKTWRKSDPDPKVRHFCQEAFFQGEDYSLCEQIRFRKKTDKPLCLMYVRIKPIMYYPLTSVAKTKCPKSGSLFDPSKSNYYQWLLAQGRVNRRMTDYFQPLNSGNSGERKEFEDNHEESSASDDEDDEDDDDYYDVSDDHDDQESISDGNMSNDSDQLQSVQKENEYKASESSGLLLSDSDGNSESDKVEEKMGEICTKKNHKHKDKSKGSDINTSDHSDNNNNINYSNDESVDTDDIQKKNKDSM